MLSFKTVTLVDKLWVDHIVALEDSSSADYNFGNIYIWDKRYLQLIARLGDRMITKLRYEGKPAFVFPIGAGPLAPAVDAIREFAAWRGYPMVLRGITDEHKAALELEYPGRFVFEEDESCADYIYSAQRLSTYEGKALHSKKNHCNRFEAEHDWQFVPLTRELIPACLDMLSEWTEENSDRLDKSVAYEHDAIIRAFAAFECLSLEGGVLLEGGKPLGFSLGEMANANTFDVHFEKADISINGAYPMVCRELTRMMMLKHPSLVYMNREDDMGLASLRQSKQSYKPEYMLRKYTGRWQYE